MDDLYGDLEEDLKKWFGRKGAPGKKKGWVDCNTCRKDKKTGKKKCSACGRSSGEKRSKYPSCRPTPSACGKRGKWGKKSKAGKSGGKSKKNEEIYKMDLYQIIEQEIEAVVTEADEKKQEKELEKIADELVGASKMHKGQSDRIKKMLDDDEKDKESVSEGMNCGCGNDPCETYGKNNEKLNIMVKEELANVLDEKRKKKKKKKKKSGKKDACYHKVKSRYKVWPSAYASGALVKCRKVGAKNWGNSAKESLEIVIEDELSQVLDEKKKKPCKPSKGKRFAKRVNGKCRSYGQAGKAKSGGDRIRPGTKKGDAYCARSAKIKKCKNPPCANALSRKKWKCRGSKSMKEAVRKINESNATK